MDGEIGNDVWAGVRGDGGDAPNDTEGALRCADDGVGGIGDEDGDELKEGNRNWLGGVVLEGARLFVNEEPGVGLGGISKFALSEPALGGA